MNKLNAMLGFFLTTAVVHSAVAGDCAGTNVAAVTNKTPAGNVVYTSPQFDKHPTLECGNLVIVAKEPMGSAVATHTPTETQSPGHAPYVQDTVSYAYTYPDKCENYYEPNSYRPAQHQCTTQSKDVFMKINGTTWPVIICKRDMSMGCTAPK